jgi:hypothetical protein
LVSVCGAVSDWFPSPRLILQFCNIAVQLAFLGRYQLLASRAFAEMLNEALAMIDVLRDDARARRSVVLAEI